MLRELFSYDFIVRALIAGTLTSLCAALLGVSLVLKRYSMIGDGLSHVGFGALSVSLALGLAPLEVSLPVVTLAAFLLLRLSESGRIKGDAAIALISSSAIAVGVIVVSLTVGMNVDVYNYMFGSILAMSESDVYLSVMVSAVVLVLYLVFYNRIFAVTFDEGFAKATGIRASRYNMLVALLTALVIVVGMRMMGSLLISSLIVFPALTAMRVFKSFRSVAICAAVLSVGCFFIGIVISFALSVPVGASIVAVSLVAFCIFSALKWTITRMSKKRRKQQEISG
jgi:ABC-type Mn2+/Zn2+ transport system permease subunit